MSEHKCCECCERLKKELEQYKKQYEKLLSTAIEVKRVNTLEFMNYWKQQIQEHKTFIGED